MFDDGKGVVIPVKSLTDTAKMISGSDGNVIINVDDKGVKFESRDFIYYSKLIKSDFPDFNRVIPKPENSDVDVKLLTSEIKDRISSALVMSATVETRDIIDFSFSDEKVLITAQTRDVGDAETEAGFEKIKGGDINIAFNGKYFIDILKAINVEKVVLRMRGELKASVFDLVEERGLLYVLMPVKI